MSINLSNTTPAAPTGQTLVTFQADGAGNISAAVPALAFSVLAINDQVGTSYTLVLSDNNTYVRMNNASPNTVTVPPNASVAFPIGTKVMVREVGAGVTTIVAGGGVTINATSLVLAGANTTVALVKVATDTWDLV